jgi:hypothetical protein
MDANDVLTLSNHDCPITRGILFLTHGDGNVYFQCVSTAASTRAPSQQQSAASALNFSWLTHHTPNLCAGENGNARCRSYFALLFCCGLFSNLRR